MARLAAWLGGKDVGFWPTDFPCSAPSDLWLTTWQITTLWVNCPTWVSQVGHLSLSSPNVGKWTIKEAIQLADCIRKRSDSSSPCKQSCEQWSRDQQVPGSLLGHPLSCRTEPTASRSRTLDEWPTTSYDQSPPHLRQNMNFARFQHKLKTFLFGC